MGKYLEQLARHYAGQGSVYAWTITHDHLADSPKESDVGTQGPSDAPEELLARLPHEGYVFRMYDDDGEHYYTGRALFIVDAEGSEEGCYGPLDDFGAPNAGCTEIRWQGHPEWDCG